MRTLTLLFGLSLTLAACSGKADDSGSSEADGADGADGTADGDDGTADGDDGTGGTEDPFDALEGDPTECDLTGQAYVLDLNNANFIKPAGVADLLLGQLEDDFTLGVNAHSGETVEAYIGLTSGAQDVCQVTSDLPGGSWDDPIVDAGPATITASLAGVSVPMNDLRVAFVVEDGCADFRSGVLSAQLDARELAPLVGELLGSGDDPDEVCALLVNFGVACEACSSDGADYCVDLLASDIAGAEASFSFQRVTAEDVAANGECE